MDNATGDLKEIFKEEIDRAFLDLGSCFEKIDSGEAHEDCAHVFGDVLHKMKGIFYQAKLDDAGEVAERQEGVFEKIARGDGKISEEELVSLKRDVEIVRGIVRDFVNSEAQIIF